MITESNNNNTPDRQQEINLFPTMKVLMAITGGVIVGLAVAHGLHLPIPPEVNNTMWAIAQSESFVLPVGWFMEQYLNDRNRIQRNTGTHPIAMLFTILGFNAASLYISGIISPR